VLIAGQCRTTSLDSQVIDFGVLMARRLRDRIAIGRVDPISGQCGRTEVRPTEIERKASDHIVTMFSGIGKDERGLGQFEPIYGLPTRSLDEWLSRNPALKKDYDSELLIRSRPNRSARNKRMTSAIPRFQGFLKDHDGNAVGAMATAREFVEKP
jgi:hypothetical protein